MRELALVAAGGAIGSVVRVLVGGLVSRWLPLTFPWGTTVVNLTGSLFFGVVVGLSASRGGPGTDVRMFVLAGLLGGFTTFSAFSFETVELMMHGYPARAAANVGGQVILGGLALWVGYSVARAGG